MVFANRLNQHRMNTDDLTITSNHNDRAWVNASIHGLDDFKGACWKVYQMDSCLHADECQFAVPQWGSWFALIPWAS